MDRRHLPRGARGYRVVSVAAIVTVGLNADGLREILEIGTSEAETIWTEFLSKLTHWGPPGVKLVICDAHEDRHVVLWLCNSGGCRVEGGYCDEDGQRVHGNFRFRAFLSAEPLGEVLFPCCGNRS